jgi:toxin ParE1/3/4
VTPHVVVRPRVWGDLRDIALRIAEDSLETSDRFLQEAENAFARLAQMPELGSARRFRRKSLQGLRLWPLPQFSKYLILYYVRENGVEIVRVLHGARDIEKILRFQQT